MGLFVLFSARVVSTWVEVCLRVGLLVTFLANCFFLKELHLNTRICIIAPPPEFMHHTLMMHDVLYQAANHSKCVLKAHHSGDQQWQFFLDPEEGHLLLLGAQKWDVGHA